MKTALKMSLVAVIALIAVIAPFAVKAPRTTIEVVAVVPAAPPPPAMVAAATAEQSSLAATPVAAPQKAAWELLPKLPPRPPQLHDHSKVVWREEEALWTPISWGVRVVVMYGDDCVERGPFRADLGRSYRKSRTDVTAK